MLVGSSLALYVRGQRSNPYLLSTTVRFGTGSQGPHGQAFEEPWGFTSLPVRQHLLLSAGLGLWLTCVILGGHHFVSVSSSLEYNWVR